MTDHGPLYNEDNPRLTADGMRELTAQEYILTHHPERYGSIAEQVDVAMAFSDRPCLGGGCDEDSRCPRHERTTAVTFRYIRMREKRCAHLIAVATRLLTSAAWSAEERSAFAELDAARVREQARVEWAIDQAWSRVNPGLRWFRQRSA